GEFVEQRAVRVPGVVVVVPVPAAALPPVDPVVRDVVVPAGDHLPVVLPEVDVRDPDAPRAGQLVEQGDCGVAPGPGQAPVRVNHTAVVVPGPLRVPVPQDALVVGPPVLDELNFPGRVGEPADHLGGAVHRQPTGGRPVGRPPAVRPLDDHPPV